MLRTGKGTNSVPPSSRLASRTAAFGQAISWAELWCRSGVLTERQQLLKSRPVATQRIGFPESNVVGIGAVWLISTGIYMIPRTAVLGAILLTTRLGAVAASVRAGSPAFNTCSPIIFGILAWLGPALCDARWRTLIPLRR